MRRLSWFMLPLLGVLAAVSAAAQTRDPDEQACLFAAPDRNTMVACNRYIGKVNDAIKQVESGKARPKKGTKDGLLSGLYTFRGGAYRVIARRHAANEEDLKARELHRKAIDDFDMAVRLDPTQPHAYLNRGGSWAELIEHDRAIADFKEALRIDPNNPKAFNNLGGVHRDKGEYKEALDDLGRAIALQPDPADLALAFFNRGTVHLQKEDYALAIEDYTAAMRYGPKDIETLAARGRAWRDNGDPGRAMADFEAALKLSAQDKRSKRVQDAVRELLRALQERAEREEAERRRAAREEAERQEAAAAQEAARKKAALAEAARKRAEAAAAAREEAARKEAERIEAARQRAEAAEAARIEAERAEAARKEAARRKAAEQAAQAEAIRKEAERLRAERQEAERQEAARRREAEEEAQRADAARREAERLRAEREEAERREAARRKEAEEKAARERSRRIALVIGNQDYQKPLDPLNNPRNDAKGVAQTLEALNFKVFLHTDLKHAEMEKALARFADAAKAKEVEAAVFFFGGHGVQHFGINYLAPVDGVVDAEKGVARFVDLQSVITKLTSDHGIRILIIDACRNNPVADAAVTAPQSPPTRSVLTIRGLKRPELPFGSKGGMLVAFATLPDGVAVDGVGNNSPFTAAFLKHVKTPGLEAYRLFRRVREEVVAATGGLQVPELWDRVNKDEEFYFKAAN